MDYVLNISIDKDADKIIKIYKQVEKQIRIGLDYIGVPQFKHAQDDRYVAIKITDDNGKDWRKSENIPEGLRKLFGIENIYFGFPNYIPVELAMNLQENRSTLIVNKVNLKIYFQPAQLQADTEDLNFKKAFSEVLTYVIENEM